MFYLSQNIFRGSEDELVKSFIKTFTNQPLIFGENYIEPDFYEQIRVPEIGRVSDLIVHCGDSRLINIEFKLTHYTHVLQQAKDHLKWADYSYICMPFAPFMPPYFFKDLIDSGIGFIIADSSTFIQVFKARHNTYKNGKMKQFRTNVLDRIKLR